MESVVLVLGKSLAFRHEASFEISKAYVQQARRIANEDTTV